MIARRADQPQIDRAQREEDHENDEDLLALFALGHVEIGDAVGGVEPEDVKHRADRGEERAVAEQHPEVGVRPRAGARQDHEQRKRRQERVADRREDPRDVGPDTRPARAAGSVGAGRPELARASGSRRRKAVHARPSGNAGGSERPEPRRDRPPRQRNPQHPHPGLRRQRRPSGPEPRRGRTDAGPAPRARHATRQGRLGRQPPDRTSTRLLTGRADADRHAAPRRRYLAASRCAASRSSTPFGAGHASTSISAALGMATARDLRGGKETVVAVIGDGALTGGLAYEAINNAGPMKTQLHRDPQRQRDVDRAQRRLDRLVSVGAAHQAVVDRRARTRQGRARPRAVRRHRAARALDRRNRRDEVRLARRQDAR